MCLHTIQSQRLPETGMKELRPSVWSAKAAGTSCAWGGRPSAGQNGRDVSVEKTEQQSMAQRKQHQTLGTHGGAGPPGVSAQGSKMAWAPPWSTPHWGSHSIGGARHLLVHDYMCHTEHRANGTSEKAVWYVIALGKGP